MAAILGLLNLYVHPVLLALSCPVTILTLGLFIIVLNAVLLGLTDWIAAKVGGIDFAIDSFGAALGGALIVSVVSLIVSSVLHPDRLAQDLTGRW